MAVALPELCACSTGSGATLEIGAFWVMLLPMDWQCPTGPKPTLHPDELLRPPSMCTAASDF
eukprot:11225691-Lingulodinium_polyedra.AAC.1